MVVLQDYMNPDPYCVDGKEYGIYNIYYDTPDDYLIRTSLSKPYYKEKIRLRSYMSPAKPDDTVFLEIKKKIGGVVNKRRITLTLEQAEAYIRNGTHPPDNGKYVRQMVLRELDCFCQRYPLMPKQYISYQRSAFFGKTDKNFRLTFDRLLTQRRDDLSLGSDNHGTLIIPEDSHLMEVKILDAMPIWLAEQLATLRIYKTSFSKYGTAYRLYTTQGKQEMRNLSYV
jgi:SPX domain protein involved in polyphosphate accumulation